MDILMPYEEDQPIIRLHGSNDDIFSDMTGFAIDGKFP
jgi:hypothetical protein